MKQHPSGKSPQQRFPGELPRTDVLAILHTPIATSKAGDALTVTAQVTGDAAPREVILHFRPLDQTRDWREIPMRVSGDGRFEAVIPGSEISARWDLQYYIEALTASGGTLWPSWKDGAPYVVVKTR